MKPIKRSSWLAVPVLGFALAGACDRSDDGGDGADDGVAEDGSGDSATDDDSGPLCVEGQSNACPCSNGTQGAQSCLPGGGGFGECVCDGADDGAADSEGDSDDGSESGSGDGMAGPPDMPGNFNISNLDGGTHITWKDVDNEDEYAIERMDGEGAQFEVLVVLPFNATVYHDAAVSGGTSYTYRVQALNAAGGSEYTEELEITFP